MQSVSSDYFDYYFGWENSRIEGGAATLEYAALHCTYVRIFCCILRGKPVHIDPKHVCKWCAY